MILGVTGKIASGKTEVMKILGERGFKLVYADVVVHDLYEAGGDLAKIMWKEFLSTDGSVDRLKLRDFAFSSDVNLKKLNELVHPIIFKRLKEFLVVDKMALESVYFGERMVDRILLVERNKGECLRVLEMERGFSHELAEKAWKSLELPKKVDFVINNYGDLNFLKKQVESFLYGI